MGSRSGKNKNIHCNWCQSCLKRLDDLDKDYAKDQLNPLGRHLCIDCWEKYHNIGWCNNCNEPIAYFDNREEGSSIECPNCGSNVKRIAKDLRPVFSRERSILLFYGIINNRQYTEANIWRTPKNPYYYVNGKKTKVLSLNKISTDVDKIRGFINQNDDTSYDKLDKQLINRFTNTAMANKKYMMQLVEQAEEFMRILRYEKFPDLPLDKKSAKRFK